MPVQEAAIKNFLHALCLVGPLLMSPLTASAQLEVMISGGFSGPHEQVLPPFERDTGPGIKTKSGASQGSGPETIRAQLPRGVSADVVILSREGLGELVAAGRIAAGSDLDLARTPLGVAVRTGAPRPDVSTIDALTKVLLQARVVAGSARADAARRLIAFLSSEAAAAAIRRSGMEPLGARRP